MSLEAMKFLRAFFGHNYTGPKLLSKSIKTVVCTRSLDDLIDTVLKFEVVGRLLASSNIYHYIITISIALGFGSSATAVAC